MKKLISKSHKIELNQTKIELKTAKSGRKENELETYIELMRVLSPDGLALIAEFIEEQESTKSILPDKFRQTKERKNGNAAQRELDNGIVRACMVAIAGSTGQNEMRNTRNNNGEDNEDSPGNASGPNSGLIDAHPSKIGAEAVQFIVGVGLRSGEFAGIGAN